MAVATIDAGIENVLTGYSLDAAKARELASRMDGPTFYKAIGQLSRVVPHNLVPLLIRYGKVADYFGRPELDKFIGLAESVDRIMRQRGIQLDATNVGVLNSIELARDYCMASMAKK